MKEVDGSWWSFWYRHTTLNVVGRGAVMAGHLQGVGCRLVDGLVV